MGDLYHGAVQKFLNKGKKIFLTKIAKNVQKPSKYMCLENVFSLFCLISCS